MHGYENMPWQFQKRTFLHIAPAQPPPISNFVVPLIASPDFPGCVPRGRGSLGDAGGFRLIAFDTQFRRWIMEWKSYLGTLGTSPKFRLEKDVGRALPRAQRRRRSGETSSGRKCAMLILLRWKINTQEKKECIYGFVRHEGPHPLNGRTWAILRRMITRLERVWPLGKLGRVTSWQKLGLGKRRDVTYVKGYYEFKKKT